jgi:hypothetical protein
VLISAKDSGERQGTFSTVPLTSAVRVALAAQTSGVKTPSVLMTVREIWTARIDRDEKYLR